jgi:hypothetical protein
MAGSILLAFAAVETALAADALNTADFLTACINDPVVTDEPGFSGDSKATPQVYCECIAGKFAASKMSQTDVDMLTKMHKDEITDEDAESYPTLEDLMRSNEDMEDSCKEKLGMPIGDSGDEEDAPPVDGSDVPQDE